MMKWRRRFSPRNDSEAIRQSLEALDEVLKEFEAGNLKGGNGLTSCKQTFKQKESVRDPTHSLAFLDGVLAQYDSSEESQTKEEGYDSRSTQANNNNNNIKPKTVNVPAQGGKIANSPKQSPASSPRVERSTSSVTSGPPVPKRSPTTCLSTSSALGDAPPTPSGPLDDPFDDVPVSGQNGTHSKDLNENLEPDNQSPNDTHPGNKNSMTEVHNSKPASNMTEAVVKTEFKFALIKQLLLTGQILGLDEPPPKFKPPPPPSITNNNIKNAAKHSKSDTSSVPKPAVHVTSVKIVPDTLSSVPSSVPNVSVITIQDKSTCPKSNPDSLRSVNPNLDGIRSVNSNPDRSVKALPDGSKPVNPSSDGVKSINSNLDGVKSINSNLGGARSINPNLDGVKSIKSNPEGVRSINSNPDSVKSVNSNPDFVKSINSNPDSVRSVNSNPDFVRSVNSNPDFARPVNSKPEAFTTVNNIGAMPLARKNTSPLITAKKDNKLNNKSTSTFFAAKAQSADNLPSKNHQNVSQSNNSTFFLPQSKTTVNNNNNNNVEPRLKLSTFNREVTSSRSSSQEELNSSNNNNSLERKPLDQPDVRNTTGAVFFNVFQCDAASQGNAPAAPEVQENKKTDLEVAKKKGWMGRRSKKSKQQAKEKEMVVNESSECAPSLPDKSVMMIAELSGRLRRAPSPPRDKLPAPPPPVLPPAPSQLEDSDEDLACDVSVSQGGSKGTKEERGKWKIWKKEK